MSSLERNHFNVRYVGQLLHRKEILRIIKSDILGNQHQDDELLLGSQLENVYWRDDILREDFPIIGKIFSQNVFSGEKRFKCELCRQWSHRKEILRIIKSDILGNQL